MNNVIAKIGSERKLAKLCNVSKSSVNDYRTEKVNISEHRLKMFCNLSKISSNKLLKDVVRLNDNWGQVKGGIECVNSKKRKGTYALQLKSAQKQWHKFMKKYHKLTYKKQKSHNLQTELTCL